MKKLFSILCVLSLTLLMVACGSSGNSNKDYNVKDILSTLNTANPLGESRDVSEDDVNLIMNINSDLYQEFVGSIGSDEITGAMNLVIKAADGKAEDVKKALETYRANLISVREPYAPEAAAVLKDSRLEVKGNYVVLALGSSADVYSKVDTAISDTFK